MQFALTSQEMKTYDRNTMEIFGVPSPVLMERAALAAAARIEERRPVPQTGKAPRVLVLAGNGNNGGDGLALGRIQHQHGYDVLFVMVQDSEKRSEGCREQLAIVRAYGYPVRIYPEGGFDLPREDADVVVDAMFGIGCHRALTGNYRAAAEYVAAMKNRCRDSVLVCSLDMPSGVDADQGAVYGTAIRADLTVTFGFVKLGQILYPGADYVGLLCAEDIGITKESFLGEEPGAFFYNEPVSGLLPCRSAAGNKGSFGKVLIIAGNRSVSGALCLCASSCLHCGAGMVKVITAQENAPSLQNLLPEAMLEVYDTEEAEASEALLQDMVEKNLRWADVVVIGPGIGTGICGEILLKSVLQKGNIPVVADADALNLIAAHEVLQSLARGYREKADGAQLILTPHLMEFARLWMSGPGKQEGKPVSRELAAAEVEACRQEILTRPGILARYYNCTVICKDARSVIADAREHRICVNVSGNSGMATAGSGDVLAGILGALLGAGMQPFEAASVGAYLHGVAGTMASRQYGEYYMLAGDLVRQLPQVLGAEA